MGAEVAVRFAGVALLLEVVLLVVQVASLRVVRRGVAFRRGAGL